MGCILLNLSKPPFNNLKLRQAAAYAVSSAQYAEVIDKGVNATSNGPFVPSSPYYVADNGYPAYNVAKAKPLVTKRSTGDRRAGRDHPQPHPRPEHHPDRRVPPTAAPDGGHDRSPSAPVQQADIINTALLGTFEAQVWRQFGAVNPDLNYIFWSPTNANTPVFAINMARNTDPTWRLALHQGAPVADPGRPRPPPTRRSAS